MPSFGPKGRGFLPSKLGSVKMTTTQIKIQTVTGLIKRSPVTNKSHKYPSSSRSIRSTGVYAQKNWQGEIEVGYWTGGWTTHENKAEGELKTFIEFAKSQGYDFKFIGRWTVVVSKAGA